MKSVGRRYLSKFRVDEQKVHRARDAMAQIHRNKAAKAIQKTWRGFWAYSHFIIVQYECTRIQAVARGRLARRKFNLKLGCAILIQAHMRRCLARKRAIRKILFETVQFSKLRELRERNAALRIQFWWRIVLDWMKEKKAALVIERFFIAVKAEVDREVVKRRLRKVASKERREARAMKGEEHLLERAWLKTLGTNHTTSSESRSRGRSPKTQQRVPPHPSRGPGMRVNPRLHATRRNDPGGILSLPSSSSYAQPPTDSVRLAASEDFSEITTPSVFHRIPRQDSKNHESDRLEDMLLEDTFDEIKPLRPKTTKNRPTTEDYIRKYGGMKTAPNRLSKSGSGGAFFSDGTQTTHVSTPQSGFSGRSAFRRPSGSMSINIGPEVSQASMTNSPRVPSTPRSNASPRKSRHPHPSPKTLKGSRRDTLSHYPPMTPTRQKTALASRGTIDTESQSTMSGKSARRASPRNRNVVQSKSKNPVMIMRTYGELEDGQSVAAEAHEMLLLSEEYGEV